MPDEQDAALYTVAAFTGLRLGELRALRWQHVSFERGTEERAPMWVPRREAEPID